MNETLEEMARALFKSWFVDFDPVRAKMEGRWRSMVSLSPACRRTYYDLFPERLVDVGVGGDPGGVGREGVGGLLQLDNGTISPWPYLQRRWGRLAILSGQRRLRIPVSQKEKVLHCTYPHRSPR